MDRQPSEAAKALVELALSAGREIMAVYSGSPEARTKSDLTPVTEADEISERVILDGLTLFDPSTPVISEEAASAGRIPHTEGRFYLVDPLDGTREFISGNGEFTVNIARIEHGVPVLGLVYAPALGRLFLGETDRGSFESSVRDGEISDWKPISVRVPSSRGLKVVASRSHRDEKTERYLKTVNVAELVSAGSSLKFCLLAAGEADLYPRFGRTMEWDTAAGHAVLIAAGGKVLTEEGRPLLYGKKDEAYANPAFIASAC